MIAELNLHVRVHCQYYVHFFITVTLMRFTEKLFHLFLLLNKLVILLELILLAFSRLLV